MKVGLLTFLIINSTALALVDNPILYSYRIGLTKRVKSNLFPMIFSCKDKHGYKESFGTFPYKMSLKLRPDGKCIEVNFKNQARPKWKKCIEEKLCSLKYSAIPNQLKQDTFEISVHRDN